MPIATVSPSDKSFADLSRLMVVSMDKCSTSALAVRIIVASAKLVSYESIRLKEDNDIRIYRSKNVGSCKNVDKNRNIVQNRDEYVQFLAFLLEKYKKILLVNNLSL